MAVIAMDLGGTKLSAALLDRRGRALERSETLLGGRQGTAVGTLLVEAVCSRLAAARARGVRVSAIGVCVPGISYRRTGRVWAPNIPGWEAYPLQRELETAVKGQGIRVALDSDRACCILGEAWLGAARGCRDAIFLAVGTGIGAGILSDGRVVRGAQDIAGAVGWLALDRPFRTKYSSCGCFEYHASGEGLAKVARELGMRPSARAERPGRVTGREVFSAYARGQPLAGKVLGQAVQFWGMAVANLVSVFNPQKVIFGGGLFGPARGFLKDIYAEAGKWAQPIAIRHVKLQASTLGADAGLYGAGWIALKSEGRSPEIRSKSRGRNPKARA